jgi:putative PIN family toxin of toxin-antitoxin system
MLSAESAMPKALIDTNVLLAACYGRRAWQSPLLTAWLGGHFDWVTSEALLAEFMQVAARPEHALRIRAGVPQEMEKLLRLRATFVTPLPASESPPCRDPNDLFVILTALAGQVDYLVTMDGDLLDDVSLMQAMAARGVRLVVPIEFFVSLHGR